MKTITITDAYNRLSAKAKQVVKAHTQNRLGWSEATFYNKLNNEDNLSLLELEEFVKNIHTELKTQIEETTNNLMQLEKTFYIRGNAKK
jgi:hypothetical protein